jgi:hypothetical protein
VDQRLEANIAGLGDQDCADADGQVLDAGVVLADVSEGIAEAGSSVNFQQWVRDIGSRQASRNLHAQRQQRR